MQISVQPSRIFGIYLSNMVRGGFRRVESGMTKLWTVERWNLQQSITVAAIWDGDRDRARDGS